MTQAARPRDRLIAVVVLSAVIGLIGGGLAAWAIYARFGPVERVITQTIVGGGKNPNGTLTAGSIAQSKSISVVEVLTKPITPASLLSGPDGIVDGFVVSADGLVISSIHAIRGAATLRIATAAGDSYPATIVRADPTHGVVLLQAVGAHGLTPLTFATVSPRIGDLAIVVAHTPFAPVTLGTGTVSSVAITVTLVDGEPALRDVLTVDATPDAREDGAPLLDGNGNVIGVVVDAATAAPGVVALSMTAASALAAVVTGTGGNAPVPTLGVDSEIIDPATAAGAGVPVGAVNGKQVTTIEGLSPDSRHPVQIAWAAEDVPQCGYCQSGQIMAAAAFLKQHPNPTDADIDAGVTNLCRCGTYPRIRKAIHRAAALAAGKGA